MPDAPESRLLVADPEVLLDFPLSPATAFGGRFVAENIRDFRSAARHVMLLPYGRNSDRSDYRLVLEEGRGTCSTKHALLAALAREYDRLVNLRLGIYEMDGLDTPGVGPVLLRYGMDFIPEAHCYLAYRGVRVDLTGAGERKTLAFLDEEEIEPSQIGAYKTERHREFVRDWATARGLDPEMVWRAREECIQALTARDGA
ncbi:MAG: hypothetical protein ACR2HO_11800 [Rubrobacteraceae bacterium]